MAVTLTGNIRLNVGVELRDGTARDNLTVTQEDQIATGTGANQCNNAIQLSYTIAGGATQSIDLAGVLVGAFSGVRTFTKIKYLIVQILTTTPGSVVNVGGNANAVSSFLGNANDVIKIGAGGTLLLSSPVDGYTVTASTGDIIDINNPGGSAVSIVVTIAGVGSIA